MLRVISTSTKGERNVSTQFFWFYYKTRRNGSATNVVLFLRVLFRAVCACVCVCVCVCLFPSDILFAGDLLLLRTVLLFLSSDFCFVEEWLM